MGRTFSRPSPAHRPVFEIHSMMEVWKSCRRTLLFVGMPVQPARPRLMMVASKGDRRYEPKRASTERHISRQLVGGRRRDGQAGPVDGLGSHDAWTHRRMAAEPPDDGQSVPGIQLPHLAGLGSGSCADLQRRLLADLRWEAPALHGPGFHRMLGLAMPPDRRAL